MHCERPGAPKLSSGGRAWCTRSFYFSFAQRVVVVVVVVVGTESLECRRC